MERDPALQAEGAAEHPNDWLDQYGAQSVACAGADVTQPLEAERVCARQLKAGPGPGGVRTLPAQIASAHTDWLYHHLTVTGPADQLEAFRCAACGAGVIPWALDLDRMEEDYFLRLAAPSGQTRTLSLEGARILATELREAVERRHALATARVGRSQACAFDLHALVPVPADVLRLGPDHPEAVDWLWTHWGTTDALRHVSPGHWAPAADPGFRVSFWAADWTPWRALERIRADWPGLRVDVRPIYEHT